MLEKYLQFRFYRNNHSKYRKYYDMWRKNVTENQLIYFEKEMYHLIEMGEYNG